MTSRNIRSTITIGGAIASSLPTSTKRAVAELQRLKIAQQQDVQEARRLRTALRGLTKGTDEQRLRAQQLADVQERINYRVDDIKEAGIAARGADGHVAGLTRRFSALRAGLGPVSLALGGVAGAVIGLGAIFSKAGREANDLLLTSARFGIGTEALQRQVSAFREFTLDAGDARQQVVSLLGVIQDFERVRFGEQLDPSRFLAASRLGINVNDLITGQIDNPLELLRESFQGALRLDDPVEARLQLERLTGDSRTASIVADAVEEVRSGNKTQEQAFANAETRAKNAQIQTEKELRDAREQASNIDKIREFTEALLKQVTSFLIPPIVFLAQAGGFRTPEEIAAERAAVEAERQRRIDAAAILGLPGLPPPGPVVTEDVPFGRDRPVIQGDATRTEMATSNFLRGVRDNLGFVASLPGSRPRLPSGIVENIIPPDFNLLGTLRRQVGFDRGALDTARDTANSIGSFLDQNLGNLVGRQGGGRVRPGELTLVGEDGPEIAAFRPGTDIIPMGALPGPVSQQFTLYVTINNPNSGLDIERELVDATSRIRPTLAP